MKFPDAIGQALVFGSGATGLRRASGISVCQFGLRAVATAKLVPVTVEKWEKRSEVPLILLALAFLVAYAWPVLDPRLDPSTRTVLDALSWTVWVAFAIDLLIRLGLAEDKRSYALHHWYDMALVALPLLRPLRLLRLLALIRILDRSATSNLAGRVLVYVAGAAAVAVGLGGLAVLDAERNAPGATITTIGDALWWACETVTTVGYGDFSPVTAAGRIVGVLLMVVGIGVVGAVIGAVTSWITGRVEREREVRSPSGTEG